MKNSTKVLGVIAACLLMAACSTAGAQNDSMNSADGTFQQGQMK